MAGIFHEAQLTTKGIALLAKAQTGKCSIQLTKAASGNGSYTDDEDISKRSSLKGKMQEFPLSTVKIQNDTNVYVKFVITNNPNGGTPLTEGYYVKEIGLYATDPDEGEILYAIATAVTDQWDYMPSYNGLLPTTITVEMLTEVTSAESVTLQESQVTYVLQEEFDKLGLLVKGGRVFQKWMR